jgi:OmpA-OmpF porin, OOP family
MIRCVAIFLLFMPATVFSQNLLRNPGFEEKSGCPDRPGQLSLANYWTSPTIATPDYFNDCSTGLDYGTEFNKKGGQLPHSGHAYAGLQFYNLNRNEFFEYIQTPLDTLLVSGQLYCIKAWVSLGKAGYAFRELGAVMSVTEVKTPDAHKIKLPYTSLANGGYLASQDQWMCISGIYKARGNERLMTIGDFSAGDGFWNIQTRSLTDSLFKSTFYFIDDVSMETIRDSSECKCISNSPSTK